MELCRHARSGNFITCSSYFVLVPKNKPDTREISYQRFLFFKNFYLLSKPIIICEGKTDNIYIRAAIRQLVGYYPRLAEQKKDQINLKVKLFQYTHTTKRLLKLGGGEDNLKQFMESFPKNCEKIEASGLQHPVIILIDNDKGANKIYSFLKKATNAKAEIKGVEPNVIKLSNKPLIYFALL